MAIRYIAKTEDYWLKAKLETGVVRSLPYGLKVDLAVIKDGREHFQILEGVYKGKKASVTARAGQSYLTTNIQHCPPMVVRFNLKNQTIYFGADGPYNAFSDGGHDSYTPISPGTYLLAIPSHPADAPRPAYKAYSWFYKVWFRIGIETSGTRFLHTGMISHGCVTVRTFDYKPDDGKVLPAGFTDLAQEAKDRPGLLGLPFPKEPQLTIDWDDIVNELILRRFNDQAVGQLVVT